MTSQNFTGSTGDHGTIHDITSRTPSRITLTPDDAENEEVEKSRLVVTLWVFVGILSALVLVVGCLLWMRNHVLA